ncbi:MAG: hypothetical protein KU37_05445 [Sulfuricurvum sp. PC08-66]|nr:MAG: hypothetical protein KU37_05445 [Sulfuricurvum sp. PC08-66]
MPIIEWSHLALMLLPLSIAGVLYYRWTRDSRTIAWATLRMVVQLVAIGYVLNYIFAQAQSGFFILGVLGVMIVAAAHIVWQRVTHKTLRHYGVLIGVIGFSGLLHLGWVIFGVLAVPSSAWAQVAIPIAGMIFANTMTVLSLFIDRIESMSADIAWQVRRAQALKAAMIPQVNAFMAVGLVSLPGMMTGQIVAGVDPLIAVRYQIVVMAMIMGSASVGLMLYAWWRERYGV